MGLERSSAGVQGDLRERWTAVVLAGSRPGGDPLAAAHGRTSKALIPVAGEAMLSRVVGTLAAVPAIGRIIVLAQDAERLLAAPEMARFRGRPEIVPRISAGGISASVDALVADGSAGWPLLVTTADNALLTPEMVAAFLGSADAGDLAVGVVDRAVLSAAYPGNRRSWLRFRGGDYTGANLFALRSPAVRPALAMWAQVEQDRKRLWRMARRFGPVLLVQVLLRRLSIEEVFAAAGRRMGVIVRPIALPFAEAGIDVDKPGDLAMAEEILGRRAAAA